MFTGIINARQAVLSSRSVAAGLQMKITLPSGWDNLVLGESIAVNGVCLTVEAIESQYFEVTLMPETLELTTFGKQIPEEVNLERALRLGDRLGGHIVQGHVDTMGEVVSVTENNGYVITIKYPATSASLLIHKGSITIDGVSLTIASLTDDQFSVALIPFTLEHSTLKRLRSGDQVNLEFDMMGKYSNRIAAGTEQKDI